MGRRDNIDAFRGRKRTASQNPPGETTMSYLKGNYKLKKAVKEPKADKKEKETSTQAFENFARERLGGSIAFVMKKNTFVWSGDGPDAEKKPAK